MGFALILAILAVATVVTALAATVSGGQYWSEGKPRMGPQLSRRKKKRLLEWHPAVSVCVSGSDARSQYPGESSMTESQPLTGFCDRPLFLVHTSLKANVTVQTFKILLN
jgi:hypothetical protein